MPNKDPHDPRMFQRYAKVDDAGQVVAIVEMAVGVVPPADQRLVPLDDGQDAPEDDMT